MEEKRVTEEREKSLAERAQERFGEKLETWKAQYAPRALSVIEVEDKMLILKPMTPAVLSQYSMLMGTDGMDVATRYAMNELSLGGDAEVIDDDDYFMAAMLQFATTVELKKGSASRL